MAEHLLVTIGKERFADPVRKTVHLVDDKEQNDFLRVLRRTGLVSPNAELDSVIYKARELCPEFPGIIDFSCWEIGRVYCRPNNPSCRECIIKDECKKVF